jgi:hypothetical protein
MATTTVASLAVAQAEISLRLTQSLGNLRLLGVGAPFTQEILRLVEADLLVALECNRTVRELCGTIRSALGAEGER